MRARDGSVRAALAKAGAVLGTLLMLAAACATPRERNESDQAQATEVPPVISTNEPDPTISGGPTITLRGTVTEGVERGCVVLQADDGKQYQLLEGDPQVIALGARVEVEAQLKPDIMTFCMQGTPILVRSARRL